MNDKNIFIGVCEDNSLHINLVKGYIDDFFNEFHNYEVLEFVSGISPQFPGRKIL